MPRALSRLPLAIGLLFAATAAIAAPADSLPPACPQSEVAVERLPSLNVPRTGHALHIVDGEPMVVGGHTSGFVPTATAEYYRDGQWHLLPTVYAHDQGLSVALPSGQVMMAGGHEQPLGIGQTFPLELYSPASHTTEGYGCLEQKRCFAQALAIDSSHVVISGNWYRDDCIELYDGTRQCRYLKPVAQHRAMPYILRTAADNAIVVGGYDNHGNPLDTIVADRLRGDPFVPPLLQQWRPAYYHVSPYSDSGFIGSHNGHRYAYLLAATDSTGQMGIVRVEGEHFELLTTDHPIPMHSQWSPIAYFTYLIADRQRARAYIVGYGQIDTRLYVAAIDYQATPARLTLHYTTPLQATGYSGPVALTPDGNLLMAGGVHHPINNYSPHGEVLLIRVAGGDDTISRAGGGAGGWWPWLAAALIVLAATIALIARIHHRRNHATEEATQPAATDSAQGYERLMERIAALMERQKLYLNADLKVSDVARLLGSNSTYVSACINSQCGCSFTQFVNTYRVDMAKQMLRHHPAKKVNEVWAACGFSNETSFFRNFKAMTGKTPREWAEAEL